MWEIQNSRNLVENGGKSFFNVSTGHRVDFAHKKVSEKSLIVFTLRNLMTGNAARNLRLLPKYLRRNGCVMDVMGTLQLRELGTTASCFVIRHFQ